MKNSNKNPPVPHTGCSKAGYKQNAPAKKNSGCHAKGKNTCKHKYDDKQYNIKIKPRAYDYINPWGD